MFGRVPSHDPQHLVATGLLESGRPSIFGRVPSHEPDGLLG